MLVARHRRDPALLERDLERYRDRHPELFPAEPPGLTRGQQRLAAEVSLAIMRFERVPGRARERAFDILMVMAKG